MTPRLGLLGALALWACAPVVQRDRDSGGALVVASLDEAGKPLTLVATEASGVLALTPDARYRLLEYSVGVDELGLVVGPSGKIELSPPIASSDEAWPLPMPVAWSDVGEVERLDEPDLRAWLSNVRVPRPPCPAEPQVTPVTGLPGVSSAIFAVKQGRSVIVGIGVSDEMGLQAPSVHRVSIDTGEASELLTSTSFHANEPHAFADRGHAVVHWWDEASRRYWLIPYAPDGTRGSSVAVTATPNLYAERIAGRFDEPRTIMGYGTFFGSDGPEYRLSTLSSTTSTWRTLVTSPHVPGKCDDGVPSLVLEMTGPGRGWAGLRGESIVEFDLDRPGEHPPVLQGTFCRNAHATLTSGTELLVIERRPTGDTRDPAEMLMRRAPTDRWATVERRVPFNAQSIAGLGDDLVIVGAPGNSVRVMEDHPERPELPPRACAEVWTGVNAYQIVAIDERTVLVSGLDRLRAVILDFEPR